jgi:hypothetical protein
MKTFLPRFGLKASRASMIFQGKINIDIIPSNADVFVAAMRCVNSGHGAELLSFILDVIAHSGVSPHAYSIALLRSADSTFVSKNSA